MIKIKNGKYKVATNGTIYKWKSHLKRWDACGVSLCGQGKYGAVSMDGRLEYVHLVVFKAYNHIDKIPKGMQIDHIDDNRFNNHYTNLRMITRSENASKAMKRSHKFKKFDYGTLTKKVRVKDLHTGKVKTYKSITSASKHLEISPQSIVDNLKGRTKSCHKIYKVKYAK